MLPQAEPEPQECLAELVKCGSPSRLVFQKNVFRNMLHSVSHLVNIIFLKIFLPPIEFGTLFVVYIVRVEIKNQKGLKG